MKFLILIIAITFVYGDIYDNGPDQFPSSKTTHTYDNDGMCSPGSSNPDDPDTSSKKRSTPGVKVFTSTGSGPCWSVGCGGGYGTPAKCPPGYEQTGYVQMCANCGNYKCSGTSLAEQEFASANNWGCSSSYPYMGISVRECTQCPLWDGTPLTQLVGRKILIQSAGNSVVKNNYLTCSNDYPYWGTYIIDANGTPTPTSASEFVINSAVPYSPNNPTIGWNTTLNLACGGSVGPASGITALACGQNNPYIMTPNSIIFLPITGTTGQVNFKSTVTVGSHVYMSDLQGEQGANGLVVPGSPNAHNLYVCPCGLNVQVFTATGSGPCWSGSTCGTTNYGSPSACPNGTSQSAYSGMCANCGGYICSGSSWAEKDFRTQNDWGCPSTYPWLPISVRECSSCVATCTA